MIRLGLCCLFRAEPIRFRRTTAAHLRTMDRPAQLRKLAELCRGNAAALQQALAYCRLHGIGCFRVQSQILPLKTHPEVGYELDELPDGPSIRELFRQCGRYARQHDIRTTFHPDQFILLSSPSPETTRQSLRELAYQAEVSEWIQADVINIHAGGGYGDRPAALRRLRQRVEALPGPVRRRLTLENDDKLYTPADLLPLCRQTGVPLVYDVHHHRCLGDGLSVAEATLAARETWDREPVVHLSSPREGWNGSNPRLHADFIDRADIPASWLSLGLTVEVEAKAKELAVLQLQSWLAAGRPATSG
ncbi:MAG: UV DNA damage repair endonuclease UvsE [Acidobacteria bacterium]|nr:UV DNA damage repair endonuclease UvsE [Acidobacteriota bacterium]